MMENRNLFVILLFIHYLITFLGGGGAVILMLLSVKSMHSFTFSKAFMVGCNGMFDTPGLSATTN